MIALVQEAAPIVSVTAACAAVSFSTSTYYRSIKAKEESPEPQAPRPTHTGGRPGLTEAEKAAVLEVLYSDEFCDEAPRQVWATLLDRGTYLCSWTTMYRLLRSNNTNKPRQHVRKHPKYAKPELVATGPNQVWTWDITYLKSGVRGHFHYLYVVIDIYSRYVVGWLLAETECQSTAQRLLEATIKKQGVTPGQLTIHADRGAAMKSKPVAELLEKLGVERSHSRPHVSNDNPYSEASFKTMKYSYDFPDRFSTFQEAEQFSRRYFHKYNNEMHHTGILLLTPHQVHYGEAEEALASRQQTLDLAFAEQPARFGGRRPTVGKLPAQVWINAPAIDVQPIE